MEYTGPPTGLKMIQIAQAQAMHEEQVLISVRTLLLHRNEVKDQETELAVQICEQQMLELIKTLALEVVVKVINVQGLLEVILLHNLSSVRTLHLVVDR